MSKEVITPAKLTTPLPHREGLGEGRVIIELQNVKRYFQVGSETVKALRGVSFKIYEGEFVTIQGTSGSGKSTLLNQLGCLDTPTSGEYFLDGVSVRTMSKTQRAHLRNRKIGFVFQNYNLLPKTTAIENVELPLMYNPQISARERRERAIKALQAVGLGDRLEHKSNQMSGGQMQRVAIARASSTTPPWYWPTRLRVTSTRARRSRCWCSSRSSTVRDTPSSSSPTTPRLLNTPAATSTCATARSARTPSTRTSSRPQKRWPPCPSHKTTKARNTDTTQQQKKE